MKKLLSLVVLALFAGTLLAQEATVSKKDYKKEKADQLFFQYSYAKAINLYKDLFASGEKTLASNIALCYYKIGELDSAAKFYSISTAQDDFKATDIYNYYTVLLEQGKKSEAVKWLKVYQQLMPSDSRAQRYLKDYEIEDLNIPIDNSIELKNLDFNSEQADFGAVEYQGNIVFTSNRERTNPVVREYNWDGNPFLSLYHLNGDGNVGAFDKSSSFNFHQGPVAFTTDGKGVWVTRNYPNKKIFKSNDGTLPLQLFYAELIDGKMTNISEFKYNSAQYSTGHAAISKTGDTLFFASDKPGGFGGTDIYFSVRDTTGNWGEPINMGKKVNTEGNEMFPFMFDAQTLYFSSDGHYGLGGLDIYKFDLVAKSNVENLHAPFNSIMDDFSFYMNQKGEGFIASNRNGGHGLDDIYSFVLGMPKVLHLTILDANSNQPIPNAKVFVHDLQGNLIDSLLTDAQGNLNLKLKPGNNIKLNVFTDGFDTYEEIIKVDELLAADGDELKKIISLNPVKKQPINIVVYNYMSGAPLAGVTIVLLDEQGNEVEQVITDKNGSTAINILPGMSYVVRGKAQGFEDYEQKFNADDAISKNNELKVGLEMVFKPIIELGKDLAEMIEINPIYFDLSKSFIRPDAALELDKIVAILHKYPNMEIEVGSHTDCRSSDAFNAKLSESRATSSKKYIQERISNPNRVFGKGYGETMPKVDCNCYGNDGTIDCTEEQHQLNRRTEFRIVKMN